MKNILYLILSFSVVFFTSCKKDNENQNLNPTGDFSFSIQPGKSVNGLKASDCFTQKGSYVNVTIDGIVHNINLYYIGDDPYTNTIKLNVGTHTIQEFIMYNDNQTPGNMSDDWVMAAAVHTGATYASLVNKTLNTDFTIESFKKNVMTIELVCYEETAYNNFGFEFFKLGQIIIQEQNFFGDICIKDITSYAGSAYEQQSNGIQLDMPALFKIEVWMGSSLISTFDNAMWHGEGQPLKVQYADHLGEVDTYTFKLYVLVKQGSGFDYVQFHTWTVTDAEKIACGTDGVVDFALGDCFPDADLIIPFTEPTTFHIGQLYGGGIIFYIDNTGEHGLIAAPNDQSAGEQWGCQGISIIGTNSTIGSGQSNTIQIVNGCNMTTNAAQICNDLVLNGYSDWFLPSKDELIQMYQERNSIGGFTLGTYWSSSEYYAYNGTVAWALTFENSIPNLPYKGSYYYVRAVRAF